MPTASLCPKTSQRAMNRRGLSYLLSSPSLFLSHGPTTSWTLPPFLYLNFGAYRSISYPFHSNIKMRFSLAAAALCVCAALAQIEDDAIYNDEIQARDARDAVWKGAHGGPAPSYRGFNEMAHGYPGHPAEGFGGRRQPRDVETDEEEGDEDGFIDTTADFANNVARAVKGAYDHIGSKADEAIRKAKDGPQQGWKPAGVRFGAKDKQYTGRGGGHPGRLHRRHVEDDGAQVDEADYDGDNFKGDDYEGNDYGELSERDVEDNDQEIDWDPSTRNTDDAEGSTLAERDIEGEDDDFEEFAGNGFDDLERRDVKDLEDDPSTTAFDTENEDIPDPKLQLEEEFDAGVEETGEPTLAERDAEPFNFFGFGEKDDRKGWKQSEKEAWKKGVKHIHARDTGSELNDDTLEGALDGADNLDDNDASEGDDEIGKRAVP